MPKCQVTKTIQQKAYEITYATKTIINSLEQINQNKKIQKFFKKLISQED